MFQVEKVNCICVDWKGGSKAQYSQASQNIRVVGAEVAYLVQVLSVRSVALPCPGGAREAGGPHCTQSTRLGWESSSPNILPGEAAPHPLPAERA